MTDTNQSSTNRSSTNQSSTSKNVWTDQIEVAASQLYEQVKNLLNDGSVRRLVIRRSNEAVVLDVPLAAGAAGLGISLLILPHLLAIVAVTALFAKFKIEVTRVEVADSATDSVQDVQNIEVEQQ